METAMTVLDPVAKADLQPDGDRHVFSGVTVDGAAGRGRGVYAARDFRAGDFVLPLTGKARRRAEIDWTNAGVLRYVIQVDDDLFMEGEGGADDYINHSCAPNIGPSPQGESYYALRDIGKGDELLIDYSMYDYDDGFRMDCLCGTPPCRGVITGFSALDPDTQKRLLPGCLPYIRRKHGAR